ncbi:MAG: hypothetical protein IJX17_03395 [Clostridia bacterium]|nr:hypothetical protein [Clostridia bacterium]
MMNLYREEEKERVSIIDKIKELKDSIALNLVTSPFNRNRNIKLVTKQIKSLDEKNIDDIKAIRDNINRLDLYDSRYGKTVDYNVMQEFANKIKNNPEAKDVAKDIESFMSCYAEHSKGVEMGE